MGWPVGGAPSAYIKRVQRGKDPYDITPVTADLRQMLNTVAGDTIVASPAPVAVLARNDDGVVDLSLAAPLTVSPDGTRLTCWLAQGSIGKEYMVSLRFSTAQGQQAERSFIMPVINR